MPVAPFVVTDAEQKLLDQVLLRWEQESSKVKTYVVKFGRWEVDPTFGPKENDYLLAKAEGTIKYMSPDRGEYRVDKVIRWDPQKNAYINDENSLERWMCDGQAIYEWDRKNKQLKVRPLPPELQGKAISEGPLPFVFGAKADELKRRYWFRDVTPTADIRKKIWLEAHPKYQKDAANFQRATVILNEETFLPEALQIYPPGIAPAGQKAVANTAFGFASPSVNSTLDKLTGEFLPPITPPFWKRVVVENPAEGSQHPQSPPGDPAQATRPSATSHASSCCLGINETRRRDARFHAFSGPRRNLTPPGAAL